MKNLRITITPVIILFITVMVIPAFGSERCKSVIGHFRANVVPPGVGHCPDIPDAFCTVGRVWGGIQGNYQFVMTGAIPANTIGGEPTVLFFAGRSTIFLRNGNNLLFGDDTGSIDLPPGQGGFASLITFDGGTGRLDDATGQIRLRGEFDADEGVTSGDYKGKLCTQ